MRGDSACWNALIAAAGRAGQLERAFEALQNMQVTIGLDVSCMPDRQCLTCVTFNGCVAASARQSDHASLSSRNVKLKFADTVLFDNSKELSMVAQMHVICSSNLCPKLSKLLRDHLQQPHRLSKQVSLSTECFSINEKIKDQTAVKISDSQLSGVACRITSCSQMSAPTLLS